MEQADIDNIPNTFKTYSKVDKDGTNVAYFGTMDHKDELLEEEGGGLMVEDSPPELESDFEDDTFNDDVAQANSAPCHDHDLGKAPNSYSALFHTLETFFHSLLMHSHILPTLPTCSDQALTLPTHLCTSLESHDHL
ncbi:hypothetical protein M404DRAFT_25358 [Pisolithus tinctorius Marx 270]|uniref:Uncharacterized protein n=1 Tax=Pisolithus tinctorius Marx 270 TaxID=870435 RepID=A0A0C3NXU5_PISTI|nr:hypothetical protein M404DRAFT_25358 [Pisolithus tinctorius Marx 270]